MVIREITVDDAAAFLALRRKLDEETKFMMYEPGERKTTVDQQRNELEQLLLERTSLIVVCEMDNRLVGALTARRMNLNRVNHSAYVVVGVLQDHAGRGIGKKLFQALEDWSRDQGIHRLELTVMCHNLAAVALYTKMGFEVEGTKKHAMRVDDQYVDEYYMAKLL